VTLSCFGLERERERERVEKGVGGVKSLFPLKLLLDSMDGAEGEWSPEHHDTEIVCFDEKGPGLLIQFWKILSLRQRVCQIEGTRWMQTPSVEKGPTGVRWRI
jgi:hypothetical protein